MPTKISGRTASASHHKNTFRIRSWPRAMAARRDRHARLSATDRLAPPTASALAVQRTGTLAWELDIITHPRARQEGRPRTSTPRACFDRGRQDRHQGRLGRPDAVGLAVGRARALARRQARVLSVVRHARRRDGAGRIRTHPEHRRPQGQEARGRGRPARQELAAAAGLGAAAPASTCAGRRRSSTGRRRCCRRRRCRASTTPR